MSQKLIRNQFVVEVVSNRELEDYDLQRIIDALGAAGHAVVAEYNLAYPAQIETTVIHETSFPY